MTVRYVDGTNGNNSYNGLSPVFTGGTNGPKATLNGAEDTPVVAGDIVWVRPGTYRELLTVDVSGVVGSPIEYRGDYSGIIWAGRGVVRITGSDNDQTAARANCIVATSSRSFRTFQGFHFDTTTGDLINALSPISWIIDKCVFMPTASGGDGIDINGATQATCTIQNCVFYFTTSSSIAIRINHSSVLDNIGHVVQNCIFALRGSGVRFDRVGGNTVKNCLIMGTTQGITVNVALSVGQTITANNNLLQFNGTAFNATATGEITENYNSLYGNVTDRTNTSTGANSNAYPALPDSRWAFELLYNGAGPYSALQMVSPFDLSSQSQLINLTGTNPASADIRGTTIQNTQREWGALEYDPTLSIRARQAGLIGGGGMIIS